MREKIIQLLLKNPPKGDLEYFEEENKYKISCIFVFYKRMDLMANILHCLNSQDFDKKKTEIILVEDRGGSEEGRNLTRKFSKENIYYYPAPEKGWGKIGYLRNYGLSKAQGEYILFLDDDTVITDNLFLEKICLRLDNEKQLDAVIPHGNAAFSIIDGKYAFHDPFFSTNRCMAYRRSCLIETGGYDSSFIGQEDVEFAIRFIACGFQSVKDETLKYYHPPLIYTDLNKGRAVGASFAVSKYNNMIKFLLLINGVRWLPLIIFPGLKNRYMGMFAAGFGIGFIQSFFFRNKNINYS